MRNFFVFYGPTIGFDPSRRYFSFSLKSCTQRSADFGCFAAKRNSLGEMGGNHVCFPKTVSIFRGITADPERAEQILNFLRNEFGKNSALPKSTPKFRRGVTGRNPVRRRKTRGRRKTP